MSYRNEWTHDGEYRGKRKRRFTPKGKLSLMAECLIDGTIRVCLATGTVYGRGDRPRRLRPDRDGYLGFHLNREKKRRAGKSERDGKRTRYRRRLYVQVHRIVFTKKSAVLRCFYDDGDRGDWREYVEDPPVDLHVDHIDRDRTNNTADNLRLLTQEVNLARVRMTEEEDANVAAYEEW